MRKIYVLVLFYILNTLWTFIYLNSIPDTINCYRNEKVINIKTPIYFNLKTENKVYNELYYFYKKQKIFLQEKNSQFYISIFNIPLKKISIKFVEKKYLTPVGEIIGIRLYTNGILVVGFSAIEMSNSKLTIPAKNAGFMIGDRIIRVNNQIVETCEDVFNIINKSAGQKIKFEIIRDNKIVYLDVIPVKSIDGSYKIGLWIRNGTSGVGTITFINKKTNEFGALGHGISDSDTNILLDVKEGYVYKAKIYDIRKNNNSEIGEVVASILDDKEIGTIKKNTKYGVYGKLYNNVYYNLNDLEIARVQDVHIGDAYILSYIDGKQTKFNIKITKIIPFHFKSSKAFIVKIVDNNLIKRTGGIVQGMSGTPIIQDNKLVGAITHVFLKNPLCGYGIFIENMLSITNISN